jgi:ABC-type nitrate/sulfonate/bicarbonate transport system permease component
MNLRPSRPRLPFDPLGALGLLLVLFAWWAATRFGMVSEVFLPPPRHVWTTIHENFFSSGYLDSYRLGNGGLLGSVLYSASNVALAVTAATGVGVTLGLLSARSQGLRLVLDPLMLTIGTVPILVTAPFFLIWFGTSRLAQVALLFLFDTTIIYLVAQRSLRNLSPIYAQSARVLGARTRRLTHDIYLPGTLPEISGGIRIALAGSWGLEAVSELLGAPEGIGRVIQVLSTSADVTTILAAVIVLAAAAFVCDAAVAGAFRYATRWRAPVRA